MSCGRGKYDIIRSADVGFGFGCIRFHYLIPSIRWLKPEFGEIIDRECPFNRVAISSLLMTCSSSWLTQIHLFLCRKPNSFAPQNTGFVPIVQAFRLVFFA